MHRFFNGGDAGMSNRSFNIAPEDVETVKKHIGLNLTEALHSPLVRQFLAKTRWLRSGKPVSIFSGELSEGVTGGTINHNRKELDEKGFASAARTSRLLYPLAALSPVFDRAPSLKVLSIGPRTEMELLHLLAIGFRAENIFAVDLISSSPFIDLGDMHKLPYANDEFDVVISSWVINYSRTPDLALKEMTRVAKRGALLAIGSSHAHAPDNTHIASENSETLIDGVSFGNSSDLLARMPAGSKFDVHFVQEPRHFNAGKLMVVFSLAEKPALGN